MPSERKKVLYSRDYSFLQVSSVNSEWYFVEFYSSPRQITANSVVDSQLKKIKSPVQNIQ